MGRSKENREGTSKRAASSSDEEEHNKGLRERFSLVEGRLIAMEAEVTSMMDADRVAKREAKQRKLASTVDQLEDNTREAFKILTTQFAQLRALVVGLARTVESRGVSAGARRKPRKATKGTTKHVAKDQLESKGKHHVEGTSDDKHKGKSKRPTSPKGGCFICEAAHFAKVCPYRIALREDKPSKIEKAKKTPVSPRSTSDSSLRSTSDSGAEKRSKRWKRSTSPKGGCFGCGGSHFVRVCPRRKALKTKGMDKSQSSEEKKASRPSTSGTVSSDGSTSSMCKSSDGEICQGSVLLINTAKVQSGDSLKITPKVVTMEKVPNGPGQSKAQSGEPLKSTPRVESTEKTKDKIPKGSGESKEQAMLKALQPRGGVDQGKDDDKGDLWSRLPKFIREAKMVDSKNELPYFFREKPSREPKCVNCTRGAGDSTSIQPTRERKLSLVAKEADDAAMMILTKSGCGGERGDVPGHMHSKLLVEKVSMRASTA